MLNGAANSIKQFKTIQKDFDAMGTMTLSVVSHG